MKLQIKYRIEYSAIANEKFNSIFPHTSDSENRGKERKTNEKSKKKKYQWKEQKDQRKEQEDHQESVSVDKASIFT